MVREIDVRIRHEGYAKATPLFTVPYGTDLASVIKEVGHWGIYTQDGEYDAGNLVGQWAVADDAAYFEIVIATDGD